VPFYTTHPYLCLTHIFSTSESKQCSLTEISKFWWQLVSSISSHFVQLAHYSLYLLIAHSIFSPSLSTCSKATLAWGVNLPAHLVIVKGTEYFDGKESRYVDYPVTDVLQMMGRAGRPQFDTKGVAVVMVEEGKKNFYKKFLYDPFPVESCLAPRMADTLNAEIATGTVSSVEDCIGYLDWTFYARRARMNPSYYGAKSSDNGDIADFLKQRVLTCLEELKEDGCVTYDENDPYLGPTHLGIAASKYYVSHKTPRQMDKGSKETRKLIKRLRERFATATDDNPITQKVHSLTFPDQVEEIAVASIFYALSQTHEFSELPVRHTEDQLNADLSERLPWGPMVPLAGDKSPIRVVKYDEDVMAESHTK